MAKYDSLDEETRKELSNKAFKGKIQLEVAREKLLTMQSNKGLNFMELLAIVFITCKLFGAITWSWWIVFIPLYIDIGLPIFVLFVLNILIKSLDKDLKELEKSNK